MLYNLYIAIEERTKLTICTRQTLTIVTTNICLCWNFLIERIVPAKQTFSAPHASQNGKHTRNKKVFLQRCLIVTICLV